MTSQDELTISLPRLDLLSILEKVILGGIIFILALPLLGDYGMWLFPLGRDVIFKLLVEFSLLLFFIKLLLGKSLHTTCPIPHTLKFLSPITFSLLAFWLAILLATIFSVQSEFSLWGNIYKNQGLMTWTHYVLFFFLLAGFLRKKRQWQFLINIAIFVATLVGLIALWQVLQNGFDSRAASTLNNSNYLAAYLVLLLPITFAFFLRNKSFGAGSAATIQLLALLATQTRGGYMGIAIAFLIFITLFLSTWKINTTNAPKFLISNFKFLMLLSAALLVATYGLLVATSVGQNFQQKLPNFTDRFLSRQSILRDSGPRLEAWRAGLQGMVERPILGYGPENFFVAFDEHYSGSQDSSGSLAEEGSLWESWFDKAHNFIFDIGTTTGFLGLFAYIMIFASAIWVLARDLRFKISAKGGSASGGKDLRFVNIGLIAAFTGYLIQNLLGFDTIVPGIYLIFLLGYSYFLTANNLGGKSNANNPPSNPPPRKRGEMGGIVLFGPIILLLALLFIASFNLHIDTLRANHKLNLAESLARRGQIEKSFAAFEEGLEYNASPINPNLRRRYAVIALAYYDAVEKRCGINGLGSDPAVAGSDPDKLSSETVPDELNGAGQADPAGLKCEWLYGDAKKYLARALVLQQENAAAEWPRFTRNYIYAAQIAHILGNYETSDVYFKKALALSPNRTSISIEWARLREERKSIKK